MRLLLLRIVKLTSSDIDESKCKVIGPMFIKTLVNFNVPNGALKKTNTYCTSTFAQTCIQGLSRDIPGLSKLLWGTGILWHRRGGGGYRDYLGISWDCQSYFGVGYSDMGGCWIHGLSRNYQSYFGVTGYSDIGGRWIQGLSRDIPGHSEILWCTWILWHGGGGRYKD